MPELPEVQTTVNGLNKKVRGLVIKDVWTDYYKKTALKGKPSIKNKKYFTNFRKKIRGKKIMEAERFGKNIVMHLFGDFSILTHMKMTGHYLYGKYKYNKSKNTWSAKESGHLQDPFNKFARLVFTLSNDKHLVLSDMRRFAKVILIKTKNIHLHDDINSLGPNPLSKNFNFADFYKIISSSSGPIKSVLMDQRKISGIGNIYSDEILWRSNIHPNSSPTKIPKSLFKKMFLSLKKILKHSISLEGDSMSDYRTITGEKGGFQNRHKVYRKKGEECLKMRCRGIIERIIVRGRSAHFCNKHQKMY